MQGEFAALLAERSAARGKPDAPYATVRDGRNQPPEVALLPPAGLTVRARVSSPVPLKWVRLRYRHLTQFEDYRSLEMTKDGGVYTAAIPPSFVDPKWGIVYFVEVVDEKGNGRMFPDLDVEQPYVVLPGR
jgi:hypothetical protein